MFSRLASVFSKKTYKPSPFIKVYEKGSSAIVTIDRPEALNAISCEMFQTLYYTLRDLESKKSHVIVKGATGKVFSSGGDVKQMFSRDLEDVKEGFKNNLRSFELVSTYKKPFVAIMDGLSMGGAACYSVGGKYRIATERSIFAMPETAIGFFNDSGASYFLSRLRNNIGIYLGLTGLRLNGFELKKVGICTHYVESKRLEDLEKALVACSTDDEIGKAISKHSTVPLTIETELDSVLSEIDKTFDGDNIEEIVENLHLDGSDWSMNTVRVLNKYSPTSLKISHRLLNLGKEMSLHDCLKLEYRLAIHHVIKSDLQEGCRAILIDKDMKPKWNPKKLHDVTPEHLDRFFGPLPDGDELTFETR